MRHVRSLEFDGLEARKLLSKAHHPVAHVVHAEVAVPIVLNGTLTVNNKAATTDTDGFGGETVSTPVTGTLSGVGQVRGFWQENLGSFGDFQGANVLMLHNRQGTINVTFGSITPKSGQKTAHGAIFTNIAQHVTSGSLAYARATESGTIALSTNAARTLVGTMTLNTTSI
jgi:hypothetical protein